MAMPPISSTWALIGVLAVWRVTHLFWGEDGPGLIFVRFRRLMGSSFFGSILDCFYCLSVWVAAPAAYVLATTWTGRVLLWAGLSGGAILLERVTAAGKIPPAKVEIEEEEHVVLR